MAGPSQSVKHVELYVDSASSPAQQAASVSAIAALIKNDTLTLESLVRDMEMYLTTTDSIIRARGILFLAELLTCLSSKPLDYATIHTLIGFFTERLADWRALRGALVGSLALMRRKDNVGVVSRSEAMAVAQAYLQNIHVQSLGQHDRKLCLELLECLLNQYPDAVMPLGDTLVYGSCEAIDAEKDPQCLMIAFHIVEALARVFPDPSGPLASFAGDIFENIGCYFPIYFTHPKDADIAVRREELSTALMMAFASTPFFEPFAIPLLLEKLSSALESTKIESLKYLSYCAVKYGADTMEKHVEALWCSIKEAIYTSPKFALPLPLELLDSMDFQDNEIAMEALILLQKVMTQNDGLLLSFILGDEDMKETIQSIASFKIYKDIPLQSKLKLYAVGRILSVSVTASVTSCNKVFESVFPHLMNVLGFSVQDLSEDSCLDENKNVSARFNFGALYLCVELLSACRYLVIGSQELTKTFGWDHELWCCLLHPYCGLLTKAFSSVLRASIQESSQYAYVHSAAKGLQILATFPGNFSPLPKSVYESVLLSLTSIITLDFNKTTLWTLVLKSLVEIGSFIEKHHESKKASSFEEIVVEKIIFLMSSDDTNMCSSLKLEAITNIGMTSLKFMLKIVQGLDKAIYTKLSEAYLDGDLKSAEDTILLLDCYSKKVLPWFNDIGGFEEVPVHFAVNIWNLIENSIPSSFLEQKLLDATMMAMKLAVGSCSVENQSMIIQRAFGILSSRTSFPLKDSVPGCIQTGLKEFQMIHCSKRLSCRDEWIISLFASVIIGLRPQTDIPNVKVIIELFMSTLINGHLVSAQALGSLVNKLPLKNNGQNILTVFSLEDAVDFIFSYYGWRSFDNDNLTGCSTVNDDNVISLSDLRINSISCRASQFHTINGLAWIGKGLLMRGHEKVKTVVLSFLSLLSNNNNEVLLLKHDIYKDEEREMFLLLKAAADAFNILISDCEACLNRKFHATTRPLYKQRFFNTVMPILQSSAVKSDSSLTRTMIYRAFAHIISNTPLFALLSEAKKLLPTLLDGLSSMHEDSLNKEMIYSLLLVLSGMLTEKNGQEAAIENAHIIISLLTKLISYPHMMRVRETAIQCLIAVCGMPHTRMYPLRAQVLQAIKKALDDPKRAVRQEAVRCRQAWASIASRSLHF